jgi:hypothetical protein
MFVQPNGLLVILFYFIHLFVAESIHLFRISSVPNFSFSHAPVITAEERTRATQNNRNKRRRVPPSPPIINCDLYINLESSSNSTVTAILHFIRDIISSSFENALFILCV